MQTCLLFVLISVATLIPAAAFAAPAKNLDQEYDQVRAIALRDPKVKAAYEKADQRLAEKIVEIDPALKGYVKGRSKPAMTTRSTSQVKPKPFVPPSKSKTPTVHTHVIANGDTLSTIAAKYKISVAALKAANPAVDEKKLQVTEKLIIPSAH